MESVTEPQPSASTSDHADDDDDVPADMRSVCLNDDEGITAYEVAVPGSLVNFLWPFQLKLNYITSFKRQNTSLLASLLA